jgi:hypothetical protein
MFAGKLIFAQLTDLIHPEQFRRCVRRYHGDYKVKTFSCWNQFLCMAFGQLTFRESLRDVETCLRSRHDQLYHLGIRGEVFRSVLADANRERDWRIYHDLVQLLIRRARALYAKEPIGAELNETVYALDSTTIDLCLKGTYRPPTPPRLFPRSRRSERRRDGPSCHDPACGNGV